MLKFIAAAFAAILIAATAAPAANAAPYLSMTKGKRELRSFATSVATGLDTTPLDWGVRDCYRLSSSAIECTDWYEFDDMTCEGTLRATYKPTGYIRAHSIGKPDCY